MTVKRVLFTLVLLCSFTAGCVSSEVRTSILALQRDHETYRKAVVANPAYSPAERELVEGLGKDISLHLQKLEELTR